MAGSSTMFVVVKALLVMLSQSARTSSLEITSSDRNLFNCTQGFANGRVICDHKTLLYPEIAKELSSLRTKGVDPSECFCPQLGFTNSFCAEVMHVIGDNTYEWLGTAWKSRPTNTYIMCSFHAPPEYGNCVC